MLTMEWKKPEIFLLSIENTSSKTTGNIDCDDSSGAGQSTPCAS
jgi:hypothetical protein